MDTQGQLSRSCEYFADTLKCRIQGQSQIAGEKSCIQFFCSLFYFYFPKRYYIDKTKLYNFDKKIHTVCKI